MPGKPRGQTKSPAGGRDARRGTARRERGEAGASKGAFRGLSDWLLNKRPVAGFVILFIVLMSTFYGLTFVDVFEKRVLPAYMRWNAQASAVILNVFGEGATANDTSVISKRFSVNIQHGCDAIEPSALFIAAVLAFPASLKSKLPGILIGTFVLAIVNLTRIVSLFYTGIYWHTWFETVHVDVWQPVFIVLALVFWILWAWWATKDRTVEPGTPAAAN